MVATEAMVAGVPVIAVDDRGTGGPTVDRAGGTGRDPAARTAPAPVVEALVGSPIRPNDSGWRLRPGPRQPAAGRRRMRRPAGGHSCEAARTPGGRAPYRCPGVRGHHRAPRAGRYRPAPSPVGPATRCRGRDRRGGRRVDRRHRCVVQDWSHRDARVCWRWVPGAGISAGRNAGVKRAGTNSSPAPTPAATRPRAGCRVPGRGLRTSPRVSSHRGLRARRAPAAWWMTPWRSSGIPIPGRPVAGPRWCGRTACWPGPRPQPAHRSVGGLPPGSLGRGRVVSGGSADRRGRHLRQTDRGHRPSSAAGHDAEVAWDLRATMASTIRMYYRYGYGGGFVPVPGC
jgi:hypothetical protein